VVEAVVTSRVGWLLGLGTKSKNGAYAGNPNDLPVHAIVVIDRPFAATGQCGEWRFPAIPPARPSCTVNRTGSTVKCQ
jgi:hypothetical protein